MYLPLSAGGLLVPSSAVAEVVVPPASESSKRPSPHFSPGPSSFVEWRSARIPLLNLEYALGLEMSEAGVRNRLAILQSVREPTELPFYGVLIQRLPTVVLANERNAVVAAKTVPADWVHGQIDLDMGAGFVPDLERLEDFVSDGLANHFRRDAAS
jgi:hypothetical protein